MRYAKFGNTDMVVSEIALGTWGIGGASWDDNSEDTQSRYWTRSVPQWKAASTSLTPLLPTTGRGRILCRKGYQFHGNPEGTVPCNQVRHRIH